MATHQQIKGQASLLLNQERRPKMITVILKALARGKLTALAVVATLIVVTASAAVATNPPMSVDPSTNEDEFNTDQQLAAAANSSQLLSQAIYAKQLTSTGRNLVEGDDREDDGRQVAAVACDEGDAVLSGGHYKVDKGTTLVASGPNPRHNSWKLVWINEETEDSIGVKVLCADMGTPDTVPAPEAAAPDATTPESVAPESASTEASASASASPEATSDPAATSPEAAAPEGTTSEASASATAPSEASASPEASVPEVSVPEATPPEGVPE
jgi:hypothetical protein